MSDRDALILALPCIACTIENATQPNRTESHHLNLGGLAGQKRRGEAYTIPLCQYHHRGVIPSHLTPGSCEFHFGPSLARRSKRFRNSYGTDDELLAKTNQMLESA